MAEQGQLAKVAEDYGQRRAKSEDEIRRLKSDVACAGAAVEELAGRRSDREARIRELQQQRAKLESQTAAKQAQIDLLSNDARYQGVNLINNATKFSPAGSSVEVVVTPLVALCVPVGSLKSTAPAALRVREPRVSSSGLDVTLAVRETADAPALMVVPLNC